jgi:hypothetical protein
MQFTADHVIMLSAAVLAGASELLAHSVAAGHQLPLHVSAATGLMIATVVGAVSKSILDDKTQDTGKVAADALRTIAASLEARGGTTPMQNAVLGSIQENVRIVPPTPLPAAEKPSEVK